MNLKKSYLCFSLSILTVLAPNLRAFISFDFPRGWENKETQRTLKTTPLSNKTSQIPEQDRELLRQFFYRLLYKEGFSYVLFGSKPMGTACYTSSLVPEMDSVPNNQILKEGWKIWSKYKGLFPSNKVIFRIVGNEEKDQTIMLHLIHREHFKAVLHKHIKIFEKILGKKLNTNQILKNFEFDDDSIKTVLKNNHLLVGILYGFGVHNSMNFNKRMKKMDKLRTNHKFKSQLEMYEYIGRPPAKTLETQNHPLLSLPVFEVDPTDPETIELRDRYQNERDRILSKCEDKDLLEVVLNEWD